MKDFWIKFTAGTMMIIGFIVLLAWAGDYDWAEQVVLRMSQEQYDSVKKTLTELNGHTPSQREIAHWWEEHHKE